jgi:hypothetical protein
MALSLSVWESMILEHELVDCTQLPHTPSVGGGGGWEGGINVPNQHPSDDLQAQRQRTF